MLVDHLGQLAHRWILQIFLGVLSQIRNRIFGMRSDGQENPARQDRPRMQQLDWMQMELDMLAAL
jgi:hypothetical protein